jgi:hypothetical protein
VINWAIRHMQSFCIMGVQQYNETKGNCSSLCDTHKGYKYRERNKEHRPYVTFSIYLCLCQGKSDSSYHVRVCTRVWRNKCTIFNENWSRPSLWPREPLRWVGSRHIGSWILCNFVKIVLLEFTKQFKDRSEVYKLDGNIILIFMNTAFSGHSLHFTG